MRAKTNPYPTEANLICRVAATDDERDAAFDLRRRVFLDELKRDRPQETDDFDKTACHVIAVLEDKVVGALRLYELTPGDRDIKIGRVAVEPALRKRGIASAMMLFAQTWASQSGYRSCYLHAEAGVRPFYERLGYAALGEEFMEAGARHFKMRRTSR